MGEGLNLALRPRHHVVTCCVDDWRRSLLVCVCTLITVVFVNSPCTFICTLPERRLNSSYQSLKPQQDLNWRRFLAKLTGVFSVQISNAQVILGVGAVLSRHCSGTTSPNRTGERVVSRAKGRCGQPARALSVRRLHAEGLHQGSTAR